MRCLHASLLLGALSALAVTPAGAQASVTVTTAGGEMTITGDGADDHVALAYTFFGQAPISGDGVRVANDAGVVPGPGCVVQSPEEAICPEPDKSIEATLAGGADTFTADDYLIAAVSADGGAGNDTLGPGGSLAGGEGDDRLVAGYSSGVLSGGAGRDVVRAGFDGFLVIGTSGPGGSRVAGDVERVEGSPYEDFFSIAPGAHPNLVLDAGGGDDSVSYGTIGQGLTASLDGVANDGPGGGQNLVGVEAVTGGSGNDTLVGNAVANELFGSDGEDRIVGHGGNDRLSGGSGNDRIEATGGDDVLDGGSGSDVLRGEDGKDVVSYEERTQSVVVSLDGQANDGIAGESDDIGADVENVFGSAYDDTIIGGASDEELSGGSGNDRIDGGGGADKIRGGFGDDAIKGGPGNDELRGNGGTDVIDAGAGEDLVVGQDRDDGDETAGIDTIELRDGGEKDTAACPAGLSRVNADAVDIVAASCLVDRSGTPAPPTAPPVATPPPAPVGPALRVPRRGIRVDRRGIARIRVTCPKGTLPCAGVLRLVAVARKKPLIVATSVYAIPGGKARTLRVRLNRRGRALLRARRNVLRVDVTLAARDRGAPQSKVQSLRLRRG